MANLSLHKSFSFKVLQYAIIFLLLYQIFHVLDHALQYYQFYVLGIFPPPALFEGLLNATDTKIHLWLNIIEYIAIVLIASCFFHTVAYAKKVHGFAHKSNATKVLQYVIIFLVVYQTLHVLDHIFQYYELYVLGIFPPPALFEGLFNESDTKIHLWINGILFISSLTIFIAFIQSKKNLQGYVKVN